MPTYAQVQPVSDSAVPTDDVVDKPLDSEANQDMDYAEDEFVEGPENNDTSRYSTFTENNEKSIPQESQNKVDEQAEGGAREYVQHVKSAAKEDAASEDSNYEDDDNFVPETPQQQENLKVQAVVPAVDEKDSYSEACEEDKNQDDEKYKEDEFEEDVKT